MRVTQFTVSRNAVCCIIAKYKETNSVRNKPGRGRKHKISRTLERKIVKDVSKEPRTSASGVDVSRNTHRPRISPLLKEQTDRLDFATEHQTWDTESNLDGPDGFQRVFYAPQWKGLRSNGATLGPSEAKRLQLLRLQYTMPAGQETSYNLTILDDPACSPDLNPSENLWGWIAREVYRNGQQFQEVDVLHAVIFTTWRNVPSHLMETLASTTHH
uniref:Uncharacterized protein n=1 Tax=Haplochromis burtoni TaxID=8153 RepID=A0A3Q2XA60_HAPBU